MKRILIVAVFAVLLLVIALQRAEVERQYGVSFAASASKPMEAPKVLLATYQEPPPAAALAPIPNDTAPPTPLIPDAVPATPPPSPETSPTSQPKLADAPGALTPAPDPFKLDSAATPRPGARRSLQDLPPSAPPPPYGLDSSLSAPQPSSTHSRPLRLPSPGTPMVDDLAAPQPALASPNVNVQELMRQLVRLEPIRDKTPEQARERQRLDRVIGQSLGQEFDARQERYEADLKELETKVQKLKNLVQRRQEARGQIISRRFEQLLRDAEGLGW